MVDDEQKILMMMTTSQQCMRKIHETLYFSDTK